MGRRTDEQRLRQRPPRVELLAVDRLLLVEVGRRDRPGHVAQVAQHRVGRRQQLLAGQQQAAVRPAAAEPGRRVPDRSTAAGAAAETVTDVPEAMAQAGDVLDLVQRLGRPPGAYRLDDVLVEYQLTRESDALPLLSAALEPLAGNPDLLVTLETYLAHDQDRRSTAAALHVHPNTLDYRLRRIVDLTGLDTSTTRGLQILAAALTARRLEQ